MGHRLQGGGPALRPRWYPLQTLRGRVALGSLVGVLTAATVFALVSSNLIRSETGRAARDELDRQTIALAQLVSDRAERDAEAGREFRFFRPANLQRLVGPGSRIYFTGLGLSPGAERPNDRLPEVAAEQLSIEMIAETGIQRVDFAFPETGAPAEAAAAPVRLAGETVGVIVLARPPSEFEASWGDVWQRVGLASLIGVAAAVIVSLFVADRVTRPLRAMQEATRRVAGGDLETRLEPAGTQELDEVAGAFNAMVARLAERDEGARQFLMKVTHDLRTPLTAIRGHAAALADGVVPEDQVAPSLAAIEGEADRLEAMVADLLDLAKLEARRFRLESAELEAGDVLRDAIAALDVEAARKGVSIDRRIGELPPMDTDGARLRQIVANLIQNAVRWSPEGASVVVEARATRDVLVVAVNDEGPGVPEEEREHIFQPFESREAPDGSVGSGLGLAISRELARALGGDLGVEPRPGGGSRFTLRLPLRSPAARARDDADSRTPRVVGYRSPT